MKAIESLRKAYYLSIPEKTHDYLFLAGVGTYLVSSVAVGFGFRKSIGIPLMAISAGTTLAELELPREEPMDLSDHLRLLPQTAVVPMSFNGINVKDGERYGTLHVKGGASLQDRKLTDFERGEIFLESVLKGLMRLSLMCRQNDRAVGGISVFVAASDIVNPRIAERLRYKASPYSNVLLKFEIMNKRIRELGVQKGLKKGVGDIFQVAIQREDLIASYPNLSNLKGRVGKRRAAR